jgi:hypothetical protein
MTPNQTIDSGIRDNHRRDLAADFLKAKMGHGSRPSVVPACFTIHTYEALRDQLGEIDRLDFLFGEPRLIASLDPANTGKKPFSILKATETNPAADLSPREREIDERGCRLDGLTPKEIKIMKERAG